MLDSKVAGDVRKSTAAPELGTGKVAVVVVHLRCGNDALPDRARKSMATHGVRVVKGK